MNTTAAEQYLSHLEITKSILDWKNDQLENINLQIEKGFTELKKDVSKNWISISIMSNRSFFTKNYYPWVEKQYILAGDQTVATLKVMVSNLMRNPHREPILVHLALVATKGMFCNYQIKFFNETSWRDPTEKIYQNKEKFFQRLEENIFGVIGPRDPNCLLHSLQQPIYKLSDILIRED